MDGRTECVLDGYLLAGNLAEYRIIPLSPSEIRVWHSMLIRGRQHSMEALTAIHSDTVEYDVGLA